MAIKISGTTVIDDSCNFTNIGTATATSFSGDGSGVTGLSTVEVLQPTNTSPANGATGCTDTPTLCGSDYFSLYNKPHTCSCFEVSLCSDFSTCNVFTCEIAGACTSLTVTAGCLVENTLHYFRLRYEDADGCCSAFSDATCFTTTSVFYPTLLGQSSSGGFYTGTINTASTNYYLIVAPNATGCACCQWKTTRTLTGICSQGDRCTNGYNNTYTYLNDATHPAGNFTATRTINSFSDWYLPAKDELNQMYTNKGSMPAGEGYASEDYWSSTERNFAAADDQSMVNGFQDYPYKCTTQRVRAVRRVAFP